MAQMEVRPTSKTETPGEDIGFLDPETALSLALIEAELAKVHAQAFSAWSQIEHREADSG